jgi:hypothetical protein
LGDGYQGRCTAPGQESYAPNTDELRQWCNLGYAARCPRLPQERVADSNRFRVTQTGAQLVVLHCSERGHAPVAQATLLFDPATKICLNPHSDPCVQRQAECALESWSRQSAPADQPVEHQPERVSALPS